MTLTYSEVGATRQTVLHGAPPPSGYRSLHVTRRLPGADLAAVGRAVLTYGLHRATGARVSASARVAAPGVDVTTRLGLGPLAVRAPCQVVWAEDGEDRAGFGYGTMPGHPFRGEEAFVVERAADGALVFSVVAFSRPVHPAARAAGPLVPVAQRAYAHLLATAAARASRS